MPSAEGVAGDGPAHVVARLVGVVTDPELDPQRGELGPAEVAVGILVQTVEHVSGRDPLPVPQVDQPLVLVPRDAAVTVLVHRVEDRVGGGGHGILHGGQPVDHGKEVVHVDPAVVVRVDGLREVLPPSQQHLLHPRGQFAVRPHAGQSAPTGREGSEVLLLQTAVAVHVEGVEHVLQLGPLKLTGHHKPLLSRC